MILSHDFVSWCVLRSFSQKGRRQCSAHQYMWIQRKTHQIHLNQLFDPGELRGFIQRSSEFEWHPEGHKGMRVAWAAKPVETKKLPPPSCTGLPDSYFDVRFGISTNYAESRSNCWNQTSVARVLAIWMTEKPMACWLSNLNFKSILNQLKELLNIF